MECISEIEFVVSGQGPVDAGDQLAPMTQKGLGHGEEG